MKEEIREYFDKLGIDWDRLTKEEKTEYIMDALGGAYEAEREKQLAVSGEDA